MSASTQDSPENKPSDKELNFRAQEAAFKRQIEQERQEKQALMQELEKARKASQDARPADDDDDDDEPYIDRKKLRRETAKVKQETLKESQNYVQQEVSKALAEERKNMWLKNNPDFYETMNHAQKFAEADPELAETILAMPEGFERQKLVYKNIKALGLHKPPEPKSTVQEQVDKNRRSPYYQPSGVGAAPYNAVGDYSPGGQKSAYDKMKELQQRLRI
jgi:hypothetical protein